MTKMDAAENVARFMVYVGGTILGAVTGATFAAWIAKSLDKNIKLMWKM